VTTLSAPRVDVDRLMWRLDRLAEIGDTGDGGCSRLALTDDDRAGRDLVCAWMREIGLRVEIDAIGNVCGTWPTDAAEAPVMMGSHIDTVRTGGRYDGNLGVLAGIEVIEAVKESGLRPARALCVAFFTDEEGSRFAPDMLGSLVYAGGLPIEDALDLPAIDGPTVGEELARIGYAGTSPCPGLAPHAYVELHIEQGPVLEDDGLTIGAVTGVQGISWQELTIDGQANHAGTTPMRLRHDAAFAAASVTAFVRELAVDMGGAQVGTVGRIELHPDLVNVVAARATLTVDLRNTDADGLVEAEHRLAEHCDRLAADEGVTITTRELARFDPVQFDESIVATVERVATELGHPMMRMPSGAGHDAQMLARVAPAGMVFVPSRGGVSHNPAEYTSPAEIAAGAEVLLGVVCELAGVGEAP
jgi:beta-ureidopropionase / N-carbamoyl-L-amino-acid hydrolase